MKIYVAGTDIVTHIFPMGKTRRSLAQIICSVT